VYFNGAPMVTGKDGDRQFGCFLDYTVGKEGAKECEGKGMGGQRNGRAKEWEGKGMGASFQFSVFSGWRFGRAGE
jgi:hypothetical protein